jgi:hypothetical protein
MLARPYTHKGLNECALSPRRRPQPQNAHVRS